MREIVLPTPWQRKSEPLFYQFNNTRDEEKRFEESLARGSVKPSTHPLAADLAAGDGGYAKWLVARGWRPQDVRHSDTGSE